MDIKLNKFCLGAPQQNETLQQNRASKIWVLQQQTTSITNRTKKKDKFQQAMAEQGHTRSLSSELNLM